jgi:membrane-associated HD superfamily phosphohydrolase
MNGEANPGGDLRKSREMITLDSTEASLLGRLGAARWFRPLALALPVLISAIVLAPRWARRTYPVDPALEGTPALEKIKAPYDLQVVDEATTAHLRNQAETNVPRVFDFDAELGTETAGRLSAAFQVMTERRAAFLADTPDYERLSRGARARADEELRAVLEELRPEFERLIEEPLTPSEHELLHETQFDAGIGRALSQVLVGLQAEPLVARVEDLASERERGITVQRVPDDGSPHRDVTDVGTIATLATAGARIPTMLAAELPAMSPERRQVLAALAGRMLSPNLTPNRAATEIARNAARLAVDPVTIHVKHGETIVRDGERITGRHLLVFRGLSQSSGGTSTLLVSVGGGVLVLILLLAAFATGRGRGWSLLLEARDVLFLTTLFCLAMVVARVWLGFASQLEEVFTSVPAETFVFIIPVAAGAMITRMVLRPEVALLFAIVGSLEQELAAISGGGETPIVPRGDAAPGRRAHEGLRPV